MSSTNSDVQHTDPDPTRINLRELGLSAGQSKHFDLALSLLPYRQGGFGYGTAGDEVEAGLDVTVMDRAGTHFHLRFHTQLAGPCSRCLDPAVVDMLVDSDEVHDPRSGDEELTSDFVDEDGQLDVSAWAQDAMGLKFPARVLCMEECAGLCAICGVNRNTGTCDCTVETHDPRWDALKGLKLDE